MGYTHSWIQKRPFTQAEWGKITSEAKRIVAKAQRGLYSGPENADSQSSVELDGGGCRIGFKEVGAWRLFPHPEKPIPTQGKAIAIAGPDGTGNAEFNAHHIALNGQRPNDYESFVLEHAPLIRPRRSEDEPPGAFAFCKTEYRPYDAVVVSILAAARTIAPDAITVDSDGGDAVIKNVF